MVSLPWAGWLDENQERAKNADACRIRWTLKARDVHAGAKALATYIINSRFDNAPLMMGDDWPGRRRCDLPAQQVRA